MNLPIIATSIVTVSVLSFITIEHSFPDMTTNKSVTTEKIASSSNQSLMAYVDPITGEFTSRPPESENEAPMPPPSVTTNSDNDFSSTIAEDGSVSIDTSHIRNPTIIEADLQNNSFVASISDDGMVAIDTSHIRIPLVATEVGGKVQIEHKHTEINKEIK